MCEINCMDEYENILYVLHISQSVQYNIMKLWFKNTIRKIKIQNVLRIDFYFIFK